MSTTYRLTAKDGASMLNMDQRSTLRSGSKEYCEAELVKFQEYKGSGYYDYRVEIAPWQ